MIKGVRVAVIVDDANGDSYRRACAVAEEAWDAGAEVRVRRAHRLSEIDDVPEVQAEDIAWADVVVRGSDTVPPAAVGPRALRRDPQASRLDSHLARRA